MSRDHATLPLVASGTEGMQASCFCRVLPCNASLRALTAAVAADRPGGREGGIRLRRAAGDGAPGGPSGSAHAAALFTCCFLRTLGLTPSFKTAAPICCLIVMVVLILGSCKVTYNK